MQWINSFRKIKILLIAGAAIIAAVSLIVSNALVADLKQEELRKMQVWAAAMRTLNSADENTDLSLVLRERTTRKVRCWAITMSGSTCFTGTDIPADAVENMVKTSNFMYIT